MKKLTILALALISITAHAAKFEAPFIDTATGAVIEDSEAKAKGDAFKVEIEDIALGEYRVCLNTGTTFLELATVSTDDDGELKAEGILPAGSYPIAFSIHTDSCLMPALYVSAYNTEAEDDNDNEDLEEDDDCDD